MLTKEEVEKIIIKVAKNHAGKTFGIYDHDDIYQQAATICWTKMKSFDFTKVKEKDPAKALENWLNKVVSNRLKNFFRDHYQNKKKVFKQDDQEMDKVRRESLLSPVHIDNLNGELSYLDPADPEGREILALFANELDEEQIDVLEAIINGDNVNSYYKKRLQSTILAAMWLYRTEENNE